MSNSRRWREFITWWNNYYPNCSTYTKEGIINCVNREIDKIKIRYEESRELGKDGRYVE